MAPKSKLKVEDFSIFGAFSKFTLVFLLTVNLVHTKETVNCFRPACIHFQSHNYSNPVNPDTTKEKVTTFCYDGLQKSFLYLWANPVLMVSQKDVTQTDGSKLLSFFGVSKADVDFRRSQQGYSFLQNTLASLRTLRQTEDFSLTPFNLSCIAIETDIEYTARINIKALDLWYVTYLVAGIVIFFSAKTWSHEWITNLSAMVANRTGDWRLVDMIGLSGFSYNTAYPEWPPFRRSLEILGDLTAKWRYKYNKSYQPQIENWIRNTTLHYGTGVSVGVLASLVILVFILARVMPARLKTFGYLLMLMGTSMAFWLITSFTRLFSDNVIDSVVGYWQYVVVYCVAMGLISFAVVYRYGPVTNERTLNLIQWLLQIIGLILIYNSTQIQEVSIALVLITLTVYNFPRALLFNKTSRKYWNRLFPPKVRLLTEEEYITQGNEETKQALEDLREYCRSPQCKSWSIIAKLRSPQRFADFVEGHSWHVSNDELLEYDSETDLRPPHELQQDMEVDDEDSEMDFILSSP